MVAGMPRSLKKQDASSNDGQLTFNDIFQVVDAAIDGFGLAYAPEQAVIARADNGRGCAASSPELMPMWLRLA